MVFYRELARAELLFCVFYYYYLYRRRRLVVVERLVRFGSRLHIEYLRNYRLRRLRARSVVVVFW